MHIDLKLFFATFFEEASENVADMENALLLLEAHPHDEELLHRIFRAAHSIKGGSGTFGFTDVASFTHALESALEKLREGTLSTTPELTGVLLRCADFLKELLVLAREEKPAPSRMGELLRELAGLVRQEPSSLAPRSPSLVGRPRSGAQLVRVAFRPHADFFFQGNDPLYLVRDVCALGEVVRMEVDRTCLPELDELNPESCYLSWVIEVMTSAGLEEVREIFCFVEEACAVQIEIASLAQEGASPAFAPDSSQVVTVSELASVPASPGSVPASSGSAPPHFGVDRSPWPEAPVPPAPLDPRALAQKDIVEGKRAADGPADHDKRAPLVPGLETSSIRVSTEKVDKIINLVGELVIAQSMIAQALQQDSSTATMELLRAAMSEMSRSTRELQERVMSVRMLPMAHVFSRFPRLVRDLSAQLGKKVQLRLEGEEIEVDKGIIERIGDPLTHLVRNAIDHGIEPPAARKACGKPEMGTITLRAKHEGGGLVVEVVDDGRGLDVEGIRRKAIAVGLLRESDEVSDTQLRQMIFEPGFSTAKEITDLSGRGVGMDVVKRNVESLNGHLNLQSEVGLGAHIRIRLPLTLAVMDGLLLKVGEQTYVLPLVSIIESLKLGSHQIRSVVGHGDVVEVRGEVIPVVRLHRIFGDARCGEEERGLLVIAENAGSKVALLVDELSGQSQVVVKSLEAHYRKVEGMLGATIMGDGLVAMILDVGGLLQLSKKRPWRPSLREGQRGPVAA